jgi:hypothetical protein
MIEFNKDADELTIAGQSTARGEKNIVRINVGRLPSGTRINIYAHVFRSAKPGPVLLLTAGMHGDEVNGVEIVRNAIESGMFENLEKGSVIAIPVVNVYGFINFSREVPDGKDVNRSFPGNMKGSLASRIARSLSKRVLPHADYGLDFHTGGSSRHNFPQIRFTKGNEASEKLAKAFAPPVILPKSTITGSFRKIALKMGVPIIVYEGGEALRYDSFSLSKAMEGINRLMFSLEMTETMENADHKVMMVNKSTWVRAGNAGLFIWTKSSGQEIIKNEPIGFIRDPYGTSEQKVLATRSGFIIGHNNAPVVNQGDALFHLGYEINEVI